MQAIDAIGAGFSGLFRTSVDAKAELFGFAGRNWSWMIDYAATSHIDGDGHFIA
jgi:hypothetical protein